MEGVPYDLSDYLSSEGLSDIMPAGSSLHDDQAGQVGLTTYHEEPLWFGSRSSLPVTDLDSLQNPSALRMKELSDTAKCLSPPMHAVHNPPLTSQYETYDTDGSQGYDITGCVHSDCADNLAQVAPDVETIANEDQYRTHSSASTFEPSEAGIGTVASQQVLGSTVSQTETGQDVSMIGPDELKVLLPGQKCHCATCLYDHTFARDELRWASRDEAPAWIARTLSCRVTGCQWTAESHTSPHGNSYRELLMHEGFWGRAEHYGKPGEWRCRETGCKFVTKRWTDFARHASSQHCIKPKDLKCPVLSCRYHLINFSRKDKLKSHVEKVHKGSPHPAQPNQAIKPKVEDQA